MTLRRKWPRKWHWWWILAQARSVWGLRSELKQLTAKVPNYVAPDSEFAGLMAEADVLFRGDDYKRSLVFLQAAASRQATCRDASGLNALGLRLAGSELLNPFGHMAIALTRRAKLRALNLYLHRPVPKTWKTISGHHV